MKAVGWNVIRLPAAVIDASIHINNNWRYFETTDFSIKQCRIVERGEHTQAREEMTQGYCCQPHRLGSLVLHVHLLKHEADCTARTLGAKYTRRSN